jgi:hypothetical protein
MSFTRNLVASLILAVATLSAPNAFAAAPAGPEEADLSAPVVVAGPRADHKLETEMVVQGWVLCISRNVAEQLVKALDESNELAVATFNDLKAARSCGQFGELRVILKEDIFRSAPGHDAVVFSALVNISGGWATAFVVYGGIPAE